MVVDGFVRVGRRICGGRIARLRPSAAFCLFFLLVAALPAATASAAGAPTSCGPDSSSNGDACTITTTDATHVRIDQPFVAGPSYEYHSVVFQPGDDGI